MRKITHGMPVVLTNSTFKTSVEGTLHLPDVESTKFVKNQYSNRVVPTKLIAKQEIVEGVDGLHTLILSNGRRYRDYGRIAVNG